MARLPADIPETLGTEGITGEVPQKKAPPRSIYMMEWESTPEFLRKSNEFFERGYQQIDVIYCAFRSRAARYLSSAQNKPTEFNSKNNNADSLVDDFAGDNSSTARPHTGALTGFVFGCRLSHEENRISPTQARTH